MKTYDVAVIGGGLAGLIAAIDLAKAGKSVVVLEKAHNFGGRAITVKKKGALFNLGGHALYLGGEAYSILQEMGVKLEGGSPSTKFSAIWMNRVVPMPSDPIKLFSSRLLSWSGKMEMARLMMKLTKMESSASGRTSLREWAEQEIADPMVRHIFYALCRTATYNLDAAHLLAAPTLKQIQRALKSGVLYLDGGWQTIVDQLRERATRAGVNLLAGKQVKEIEHDGKVRRVIFSDGESMDISNVISTASPAETCRMVRGAEHTVLGRWREEARPVAAACLDLCLKKLPIPGRNYAMGLDLPIFFTNHSASAKLSEDGTLVVHLIKYHGSRSSDPKSDELMLEKTMSLLHPGWQREVVERQYLPNITVVHDYPHAGRTELLTGPAVPDIHGLYVAGDWASHGEMLVDAAAASARRAARAIISKLAAQDQTVPDILHV